LEAVVVEGGRSRICTNINLGPVFKETVDGKFIERKRYSYQEFNYFNAYQRNKIWSSINNVTQ